MTLVTCTNSDDLSIVGLPRYFLLYVECLSAMIHKVVSGGTIHEITVAQSAPSVSHFLFLNDSILVSQATREEVGHLNHILHEYETTLERW